MSKRKKKTETVKSSPLTDKGYRVSIDPALMGRRYYGRSPLDEVLESEDAMMAREIKEMRVDELNLKRRAKMVKLQKEIEKLEKETEKTDSDDSDMPRISVAMAQQIARLPPGERDKVIETYAMFRSVDQSKGRGDSLLPLLIGFSKSNPGTQQSDMATYAKAMSDQFKTGIEAMKAVMPPKEKASNATELLKIFKDLVTDSVKTPMQELVKNMQPQPSAFEQIIMNPEMRSAAKEMGMFGGSEPKTGSTSIDLEIEKLRGERQLEMKKLDLSWRKTTLETEAKERSEGRRNDNLLAALSPLTALFAGPIDRRMRQLGQQQAATHIPPMGTPPLDNQIMIQCSCGHLGPITFEGPPPNRINCPSCGLELNVGDAPSGTGYP